jgi:hypothetical protein
MFIVKAHGHLKIIDCLTARVFFISAVNGCSKKKKPILCCASSGHNKQTWAIYFCAFDIYVKATDLSWVQCWLETVTFPFLCHFLYSGANGGGWTQTLDLGMMRLSAPPLCYHLWPETVALMHKQRHVHRCLIWVHVINNNMCSLVILDEAL